MYSGSSELVYEWLTNAFRFSTLTCKLIFFLKPWRTFDILHINVDLWSGWITHSLILDDWMLMAFTEFLLENEMSVSVMNEYIYSVRYYLSTKWITQNHRYSACIFCCPLCIYSNIYCFRFWSFAWIWIVFYRHVIYFIFLGFCCEESKVRKGTLILIFKFEYVLDFGGGKIISFGWVVHGLVDW